VTGVEAEALIAPSSAVVESVLKCNDSVGFYDVCRQIVPFSDHSVAEVILPDIQMRSLLLKLVQVASSVVVRIVQLEKTIEVDIFFSCQQLVCLDQISSHSALF